jgi:Kef-type K+ transport system membrane component KefB
MTPTAIRRFFRIVAPATLLSGRLAAGLCVATATVSAQTSRAPAHAVLITARWDSLYQAHRLFELRESVNAWRGPESISVRFYRGIVAHAFNNNDVAIRNLAPIVDSTSRGLTPIQLRNATDVLGDSYRRVYRYRESASAYRTSLRIRRQLLDAATRRRFATWATIGDALAATPPVETSWSAESNGAPLGNDSVSFGVSADINGARLSAPMGIDATARLSILDSTAAANHRIRALVDSVSIEIAGNAVIVTVGVADRIDLGPAHLTNVPVVIVPDDALRRLYKSATIRGILGRPVLSALGAVTFTGDGHIALTSPGADHDTSTVATMALAEDATLVEGSFAGRRVPLLLDAGAGRTLLFPEFLREFSAAFADARLTTYIGPTRGNDVVSLPSYVIPQLTFTFNGKAVTLDAVHALMRNPDSLSDNYMGALGKDALAAADRVTLDFGAMTIRFRNRPPVAVLPQLVYPTGAVGATGPASKVPEDIAFVALLFALFVIPKALQRYRLASAITSLLMGIGATALGLFHNDPTLHLLSTFGIVALFLFAGLEIDAHELRRQSMPLMLHGLVWSLLLAAGAAVATFVFGFPVRPALLIALALLTPSTGFILSSLQGFGLLEPERFAVKTYVIGSELLALTVLFFVLQSTSLTRLAIAVGAMLAVVTIIPLAFKLFARMVAPHAPRSEFAFLLMVAVVCAYATRRLGVYYLVGAFLVGVAAQRFRSELPAMSSERMVDALESFGSVFIPFYFFHAGTEIHGDQISLRAILVGLALVVLLIPLRIGITMLQRHFVLHDPRPAARRIGIALVPTLVFTLVLVDILNTNFDVDKYVLGALVLYTVINTSIPAFILHSEPPQFENVSVADIESAT